MTMILSETYLQTALTTTHIKLFNYVTYENLIKYKFDFKELIKCYCITF